MIVTRLAALLLTLAAALAPAWADDPPAPHAPSPPPELPAGVVARVWGRDIREADVLERIVQRWGGTERGKAVLDQLVDDTCVALEAARKGVTVTDEEVAAHIRSVEEEIKRQYGGARSLEDLYRESHSSAAEFAREARKYLVQVKMAAEELGAKPGAALSEAHRKLWLSALRHRLNVKFAGLPEGVVAQIGDAAVDRASFARALSEKLPSDVTKNARDDLVQDAATEHVLAEAKISVADADVDAEIAKLRGRFSQDPRVQGTGLTFDEFLRQRFGTSEAELRTDRSFRSRLGLERLLLRRVSDEDVKKQWTENRDAYGERAMVRTVYVAAGEEGGKFQMRSFKEAQELAFRAKAAVLEASGGLPGTGAAGGKPLRDAVTAVAKQFEPDKERKAAAGEPVAWTRVHLAGEDALLKAVFEDDVGVLLGPVRARTGWFLVFVEERRPAPSFEEIADRVREDLLRDELGRFRLSLRADPGVVLAPLK